MLNQNAIENDPHKIDTFKEVDVLTDDFFLNFKIFQSKYEVNYVIKR